MAAGAFEMSTVEMNPPKPVQRWQADDYAVKGRFVSELARPVVDLLAPRKGERILDLGCGDGVLTEAIAAYGADVLGADLSEELLEAAAAKGLKVQKVDGHALPFENEFDAVFTNAALQIGMKGWLETFGRSFFEQFEEPERAQVFAEVIELLSPSLCDIDGVWTADHIRLRFAAERVA